MSSERHKFETEYGIYLYTGSRQGTGVCIATQSHKPDDFTLDQVLQTYIEDYKIDLKKPNLKLSLEVRKFNTLK